MGTTNCFVQINIFVENMSFENEKTNLPITKIVILPGNGCSPVIKSNFYLWLQKQLQSRHPNIEIILIFFVHFSFSFPYTIKFFFDMNLSRKSIIQSILLLVS